MPWSPIRPYGIDAAGRGTIGSGSKAIPATTFTPMSWDKTPASADLMSLVFSRARWQIIFGGNYYKMPPASCWLVWDKQIGGSFADCELAWTNLPKAVQRIRYRWSGFLRQNNEPRGDHPTQKPVEVMKWCLAQLPDDATTILDPFMGSGTTGVACVQLGRRFIGIEREREYFDAACRRIAAAYAQPRLVLVPPAATPAPRRPARPRSPHGGSHAACLIRPRHAGRPATALGALCRLVGQIRQDRDRRHRRRGRALARRHPDARPRL